MALPPSMHSHTLEANHFDDLRDQLLTVKPNSFRQVSRYEERAPEPEETAELPF